MPRPRHCRRVVYLPKATFYKPRGVPLSVMRHINLTVDELEAIRLADLQNLYQEQAARQMNVSRQTFGRIIESAHKKIADALVNGKALKIEGGIYTMAEMRKFKCYACNHVWEIPYGTGRPQECPQCRNTNIHRAEDDRGYAGRGGAGFGRKKCGRFQL